MRNTLTTPPANDAYRKGWDIAFKNKSSRKELSMDRISVKSSNISSVGYDRENQVLEVQFKNGGVFQYEGVPAKQVAELHAAESIGKYLHANIKPNYKCNKVEEDAV